MLERSSVVPETTVSLARRHLQEAEKRPIMSAQEEIRRLDLTPDDLHYIYVKWQSLLQYDFEVDGLYTLRERTLDIQQWKALLRSVCERIADSYRILELRRQLAIAQATENAAVQFRSAFKNTFGLEAEK